MISKKIRNPLSLFDVRDKVAIVTGASGSFGHACAVALGALGAKLLLASGTAEELEAVVNDVRDVAGKVASIVRRPDTIEDAEAILKAALDAYAGSISWWWLPAPTRRASSKASPMKTGSV